MDNYSVIDDLLADLGTGSEWETPSQFFDFRQPQDPFLAERRLLAAAFRSHLEDWRVAHLDWRLHPSPTRREHWKRELTLWFSSNSEEPCSFAWYCHALRLDVDAVRKKVFAHEVGKVDRTNLISTNHTVIQAR